MSSHETHLHHSPPSSLVPVLVGIVHMRVPPSKTCPSSPYSLLPIPQGQENKRNLVDSPKKRGSHDGPMKGERRGGGGGGVGLRRTNTVYGAQTTFFIRRGYEALMKWRNIDYWSAHRTDDRGGTG